ncbi:StbB family protein [Streptomyces cyaneofuscatus]|uniref:StbB family protein n=1 Tax=Streptomyces cyaneofuscatus TaxID=66883 RepID=UPI002FF42500
MKVVICSLGGSVGKTTITAHMLCPRMPDAKVITVDTSNATVKHFGIDADEYSGEEFTKLYKQLVRLDTAIIDVGGSKEGKEFLEGMDWMDGHDEIDAFVIPSTSDDKSQKATFKTIELLMAQGVAKNKIKVIFNGVVKNTVDEFDYLLGALTAHQIPFAIESTIFKHDLFDILSVQKRSLESILKDKTNYKQLVQKSDDDAQLAKLMDLMVAQKAAPKVNENLDTVFNSLFPVKKAEVEPKRASAKA